MVISESMKELIFNQVSAGKVTDRHQAGDATAAATGDDVTGEITELSTALNSASNEAQTVFEEAYDTQVQSLTWDQNDEKYREVLGGIVGGTEYQSPALFVETLEAVYEIKYNFSQNAKDIIKEAYSIDLSLELTSDTIKSISDNLLFQKDKNDVDTTRDYWYFNGDFTTSPAFDRLELMEKVHEAYYELRNNFSANAKTMINEIYSVDLNSALDKTKAETLSNDLLFQKDKNDVDTTRDYWYFNGDFTTSPAFDRLELMEKVHEAYYELRNNFSANAKTMINEIYSVDLNSALDKTKAETLSNDLLFQKDKNDVDTTRDYWYFNGDFTTSPAFDRLELMEKVHEAYYELRNNFSANAKTMINEIYSVDLNSALDKTKAETLSNDLLFQKDKNDVDTTRDYWYFNGDFTTSPAFDRLELMEKVHEAYYELRNNFSANAKTMINEIYSVDLNSALDKTKAETLSNDLLFQKDKNDVDTTRDYWYFNGDFTTSPAFDRLELMEKVHEAYYELRNNFSANAKTMINEIYSVDLNSALDKTKAETLSNDLLFQKDKNDVDTTRDYWYFNGDFTTSPAFDRLELMEKVHEAYYELRNNFSANAKTMINEIYSVDLNSALDKTKAETLSNDLLFQKDKNDVDTTRDYWYFNGDFTTSPAFDRLELMEKVHEAYYELRNNFSANAKTMINEIYSVDLNSALDKTKAETLSNDLLFQKDKNDVDTTRDYWYFNGDFTTSPAFDRLELMEKVHEAYYELRNNFSANAKTMINEIYSVDLNSALDKTKAETLSNDLLFQKDKNDVDTTRDYWYFNGDFTTSPAFDRLELMEKVHEAYYELRNNFSANAKTMINEIYSDRLKQRLRQDQGRDLKQRPALPERQKRCGYHPGLLVF